MGRSRVKSPRAQVEVSDLQMRGVGVLTLLGGQVQAAVNVMSNLERQTEVSVPFTLRVTVSTWPLANFPKSQSSSQL